MKSFIVTSASALLFVPVMLFAGIKEDMLAAGSNGDEKRIDELVAQKGDVNVKDEDGKTPLMKAVMASNLAGAKALVKHKAKVNAKDRIGNAALNLAVQFKRPAFVQLLLENKADPNSRNSVMEGSIKFAIEGKMAGKASPGTSNMGSSITVNSYYGGTPLFVAAVTGQRDVVKMLLAHKAKPDVQSKFDKTTPLLAAISIGDIEMMKMLLAAKADASLGSVWWTPLTAAVSINRKDMVALLLEHKAKVDKHNGFGLSALHWAAETGKNDIAKLLLDHKATVDLYSLGCTPLFIACQAGNKELVNLFLSKGAKDRNNFNWNTAFTVAAFNGHIPIVKILIEHKFDTTARNGEGWGAIHMACQEGNLEMVKLLVENGANINQSIYDGRTPLMIAAQFVTSQNKGKGKVKNHNGVARYLISKGAKLDSNDQFSNSFLSYAAMGGNLELVKAALTAGCQVDNERFSTKNMLGNFAVQTPLMYALANGHAAVARFLISKGAKTNARFQFGGNVIHYACQGVKPDIVKQLVAAGCNIKERDIHGQTAMEYAIMGDNTETLNYLLANGFEVNSKTGRFQVTPVITACQYGSLNALKILVAKGAEMKVKDNTNYSPMMLAAKNGDIEMAKFLVSKGADINENLDKGWTPLHVAAQYGRTNFINALFASGVKYPTKKTSPVRLAWSWGHMLTAYNFYLLGYNK